MTIHKLKTWPEYFEAIITGRKNFDVRKNDRNFQVGDRLDLLEWNPETGEYTGRFCNREITYILNCNRNPFIKVRGYVILSLK